MLQKQTVDITEDVTADFLDRIYNIEINSRYQYRIFFRTLKNGLHVIKHDHDFWHRVILGTKRPRSICVLRDKINRRLKGWKNAVFSCSHSSSGNLWVTLRLSDCLCVDCGVFIKPDKQRCLSCACYFQYKSKPFHDDYTAQFLDLNFVQYRGRSEIEMAYRMAKMLGPKEKLEVTHVNCVTPKRCKHVRGSLLFKFSAGALPSRMVGFRFSTVGKTTRIIRK